MLLSPAAQDSGTPITFVGGKGGVGKTTLAAAYALSLAEAGFTTLVISTDPAHSLGDALEVALGDRPRQVAERLWAAEPDAEAAVRRRVAQVTEDAYSAVPAEIMPAVKRHLAHAADSPGMAESALSDLLIDYMEAVPRTWDRLVVDSAPTGHLLRMLHLPALLTPWVSGLARQRERAKRSEALAADVVGSAEDGHDPLLDRLHARRRRLERAAALLREQACVRLVTLPRRMVLAETERAAQELRDSGFRLGPVTVNQIPGAEGGPGAPVAAGPGVDPQALEATRRRFAQYGVIEIPLEQREPTGLARLRGLAERLPPARCNDLTG